MTDRIRIGIVQAALRHMSEPWRGRLATIEREHLAGLMDDGVYEREHAQLLADMEVADPLPRRPPPTLSPFVVYCEARREAERDWKEARKIDFGSDAMSFGRELFEEWFVDIGDRLARLIRDLERFQSRGYDVPLATLMDAMRDPVLYYDQHQRLGTAPWFPRWPGARYYSELGRPPNIVDVARGWVQ